MRTVAISRVLDEADIVEAFVRHTACYVDHHIFMDNGSQDGTLQILASLQQEGLPLSVFQNRSVSFNHTNPLTFMFRQAIVSHAADWVACLDVDEFLDDRRTAYGLTGMLEHLADAEPDIGCIEMPMVDYIACRDDVAGETIVPVRIGKRREPSNVYKVVVRAGPENIDVEILAGGHGIKPGARQGRTVQQADLRLAHYSERSAFQYIVKFIRGWNKILAASAAVAKTGASNHYRRPYEILRDRPAELLRSNSFMGFKNDVEGLFKDPIVYLGGALRYTSVQDEAMRAVRSLMGTMQDLALRHGTLIDMFPNVKEQVAAWDTEYTRIL